MPKITTREKTQRILIHAGILKAEWSLSTHALEEAAVHFQFSDNVHLNSNSLNKLIYDKVMKTSPRGEEKTKLLI